MKITKSELSSIIKEEAAKIFRRSALNEKAGRAMSQPKGRPLTTNRRLRADHDVDDDAHAVMLELGAANGRLGSASARLRAMAERSSGKTRGDITVVWADLQDVIQTLHTIIEEAEELDYA